MDHIYKKFTVKQLRIYCKKYNLRVYGNKQDIINRIYKFHLKYVILIQKYVRRYIVKKWCISHGPAINDKKLCVNVSDFATLEPLENIPKNQFISFYDGINIYGADISSFYTLYKLNNFNKNTLNPYDKSYIPETFFKQMKTFINCSKILNVDVDRNIKKDNVGLSKEQELQIVELFHEIDMLGNYTQPNWFISLDKQKLLMFINNLQVFWNRKDIEDQLKIFPSGYPFKRTEVITKYPFLKLRGYILKIMYKFIKTGVDINYRTLGANMVLTSLTYVSGDAAAALYWLRNILV